MKTETEKRNNFTLSDYESKENSTETKKYDSNFNYENIHRGDIVWAKIPYTSDVFQNKIRPCLIIQNEASLPSSKYVTVIPMTSKIRNTYLDEHIIVDINSMAYIEGMTTIPKHDIENFIGRIDSKKFRNIMIAVHEHFGLL